MNFMALVKGYIPQPWDTCVSDGIEIQYVIQINRNISFVTFYVNLDSNKKGNVVITSDPKAF